MRPQDLFANPRRVDSIADMLANVWQLGYVTTDLERAMALMADTFGLTHSLRLPTGESTFLAGETPAEWEARFAMGARGGLVVELIEPVAGAVDYYRRILPADGSFAVRFHHFAVTVPTGDDEWERVRAMLSASGLRFDYTLLIPGRVRAGYIDTAPALGHMIEVCQLQREDLEFFGALVEDGA